MNLYSTNDAAHNFGNFTAHYSTEPGISSQAVEYHFDTFGLMNTCDTFFSVRDARRWRICNSFRTVGLSFPPISGILIQYFFYPNVMTMAAQTVSITIGPNSLYIIVFKSRVFVMVVSLSLPRD